MFQKLLLICSFGVATALQPTCNKRPLETPPPSSDASKKNEETQIIFNKKPKNNTSALMGTMRIALTFGDAGENHQGMEMVGNLGDIGSGFTLENILTIKNNLKDEYKCEFLDFSRDDCETKAAVLVIRNFVSQKETEKVFQELNSVHWDRKYYDTRRKKVLNKLARANIVILNGISQAPDYENKKGTIVDGKSIPHYKQMQEKMVTTLKKSISNSENNQAASKFDNLICEGNKYYDLKKCGIGYHGDAERRKVICVSLGANNYPMQWCWFQNSKPVGEPFKVNLNNGDVYIMSEKAVGYDWKKRSQLTLRHAAGADSYLSLKRFNK